MYTWAIARKYSASGPPFRARTLRAGAPLIHVKDNPAPRRGQSDGRCAAASVATAQANGKQEGGFMSDRQDDDDRVPLIQRLLDNPFLLLFLGVLIPMVVYTVWGVIDILTIPAGQ
jgi:hypothetical protein